jgi:acetoin:2,6-dichlorophenolindophenol oxidoreductase subunit beta
VVKFLDRLREGLAETFAEDERVLLLGEDVLDPYGGAFGVTRGLSTRFPGRVLTTPIAEGGIVGVGVGLALRRLRPIVEIMFGDFVTLAVDQLVNHAAKFRGMYAGQVSVPLVVRTPMGGRRGYGPTHSQSLEKLLLGVPHLRVAAPSVFHDPAAMLKRAVLGDDGPTVLIEHKLLYPAALVAPDDPGLPHRAAEDPTGYGTRIVRNFSAGAPDVTIACHGGATLLVSAAMRALAEEEIRVEAVVPGALHRVPVDALRASASCSRHLLVVEEGSEAFGWGAEVAAQASSTLWGRLDRPVTRFAARDTIVPAAPALEAAVLRTQTELEDAVVELLA